VDDGDKEASSLRVTEHVAAILKGTEIFCSLPDLRPNMKRGQLVSVSRIGTALAIDSSPLVQLSERK